MAKRSSGVNTASEEVCFSISGESLTGLVRSLWAAEDKPDKALAVLEAAFPTMREADRIAICTGSLKLIGDSRDANGVELVDDDATEIYGIPLSLTSVIEGFQKQMDQQKDAYQLAAGETEKVASDEGLVAIPRRKKDAYYSGEVALSDIEHYEVLASFCNREDATPQKEPENIEEEEKATPPPEPHYSIATDCGWLTPDGRFYPCGWMEHLWLVGCFDLTGEKAEQAGWIKISDNEAWSAHHLFGEGAPPTQRQIDLVFDWYTKRGRRLPYWMSGLDEE
jgi:hypothetical protein